MRKKKRKKHFQYGLAILLLLFVVVGLTKGLERNEQEQVVQRLSGKNKENKEQTSEEKIIRVLIMDTGYKNITHPEVILSVDGNREVIRPDDSRFDENQSICIESEEGEIIIENIQRGYGTPSYNGTMELYSTAEGVIIINELPVESYLCAVVPSEMPASYELEALKVQAVCARSYAYRQMEKYAYPEYQAHVNDSTDYQVYGNSKPQETTNQAVKETEGEAVYYNGDIVTTYYYSTSCGKTTDVQAWGTKVSEKNKYLRSVKVKGNKGYYEKELPWYRWSAKIPVDTLSDLIGINTGKDIGKIKDIKITKRGAGDIVLSMDVIGEKGKITIETENKIRAVLGGKGYDIIQNDGNIIESRKLLPSAFFTIEKKKEHFIIEGGGFGHGIGMSQNGANEMAKAGKNYKQILKLFYQGVKIH